MNTNTNFPAGSYVEWTEVHTGDRYRGKVVKPKHRHYGTEVIHVEVKDIKLYPTRKDAYAIGEITPIVLKHANRTGLKRIDLPTEANKTRKSELLTELRFKPEDGVFPGGINVQNAKNRVLQSHPEYFATRNQRRRTLRKRNSK